ncbi:transmembrane protein 198 [Contarinia nasturtii]|uniref:transmembrane protein 198 n=1 Tax=Contarinia nasturtii TaxID=265458 RepID=UPI0012D37794|nr:transmembrane protein 198 [Contarinia nasturtii]XP_031621359.1 transmembrane protein 198 [Contarinia nasturtii]XP_031621360.1 transmembrane protein 198 [Contarinia nasturtii]XP_031621361.1 transmembrane protein 198 [Contarinia nasturtii]XP_031621362.1 transmembrane protein 198 [Contarinia nasturtii]XP_031621364.1 transmembrane protein 198 [Contarinia nasturtii]
MHFQQHEENRAKYVMSEPKIGQTIVWPFMIQNAMNNPSCTSTPPETILSLLWTTVAVFGIVFAILGYRCLRAVGFLSGLAAGTGCVLWLKHLQIELVGSQADSALAMVSGLLGAVLGSTHPIASVLVSATAGAITSGSVIVFCIATLPNHEFGLREIEVAVGGGAIIFAVTTLLCDKFITIVSSSIVGTTMIMSAIDFFMHGSDTIEWIVGMKFDPPPPPCWGGLLICIYPGVIVFSVLVQCFITAWRVDHKHARARSRRRHTHHRATSRPRETREEARQRKYRYLYQVRTARGDIISQNYVSALQKRVQPGYQPPSEHSTKTNSHERNTLNSDRTHFTNIPADSDIDKMDFGDRG